MTHPSERATQLTQIKSWSISRLQNSDCPRRMKFAHLDRIPEPERGDPPAKYKGEWPNDRGTRIHALAEEVVRGERDIIPELKKFEEEFRFARALWKKGIVQLEQKWAIDIGWNRVEYLEKPSPKKEWDKIWGRVIPDMLVWFNPYELLIVDFKTGKRYGNEIKHADQLMLYAVVAAMLYPKVTRFITELWYLDTDDLAQMVHSRNRALMYFQSFNERAIEYTRPRRFWPARPNIHNCKFCPYKTGETWGGQMGTGDCDRNP